MKTSLEEKDINVRSSGSEVLKRWKYIRAFVGASGRGRQGSARHAGGVSEGFACGHRGWNLSFASEHKSQGLKERDAGKGSGRETTGKKFPPEKGWKTRCRGQLGLASSEYKYYDGVFQKIFLFSTFLLAFSLHVFKMAAAVPATAITPGFQESWLSLCTLWLQGGILRDPERIHFLNM